MDHSQIIDAHTGLRHTWNVPDSQKSPFPASLCSAYTWQFPTQGWIKGGTFQQCWEGILRYMCDPREIQGINEHPPIPRCSHISLGMDSTLRQLYAARSPFKRRSHPRPLSTFRVEEKKRKEHLKRMKPQKHKV